MQLSWTYTEIVWLLMSSIKSHTVMLITIKTNLSTWCPDSDH